MPTKFSTILVLLISMALMPLISHAEVIKIGVFSAQNFRTTMKEWANTADYLHQQLPQHIFQILPYSQQSDLVTDLDKNKLDFLLTRKYKLAQLMTDFSLNPILNVEKNTTQWILARNDNLPYSITYSITNTLLKQSARQPINTTAPQWVLSNNAEVQLSSQQQIRQLYNQLTTLSAEMLNQHWTLFLAALLSGMLILLYRKWDHYHRRTSEIKKHQQQAHDTSLNDTVF